MKDIKKKLRYVLDSSKIDYKSEFLKQESLKDACIFAKVHNLTGQVSGPLIERYVGDKYGLAKNKPSVCNGDLCMNNKNQEIKASLGGKNHDKFNFVQLRLNHDCDYIFIAYYISDTNLDEYGELFTFKLDKRSLKKVIVKYGTYAHGTVKKLGPITKKSLNDLINNKEYAIRPKYGDKCWNKLLKFRVDLTIQDFQ